MTPDQKAAYREHCERAEARAKAVLKPGDRIRATQCGGSAPTFTFVGFRETGRGVVTRTDADVSSFCIIGVNRKPLSFRDDPAEHLRHPFGAPS